MTKPTVGQSGFNRYQDVIGQFPSLKCYNHGLLVFPLADDISRDEVIASLKAATAKIISQIPWLGDQVIHEGQEPGNSGVFKTAPWPIDRPPNTLVYVKDCTDLCPSYETIATAQAPASMLDGRILCPFPGFPLSYREDEIGPAPVAAVQANFIRGGVILNFSNQHNMMDASGMFVFMALLATAMCGQDLPEDIVAAANLDRAKVIPLLGPDEPIRDHSHLYKPSVPPALPALSASPAKWAFFRFFKSKMPQVKAAAQDPAGFDPRVSFISTNDALSAFYWKRLAAVRLANGVDPTAVSKFSRAIDVRGAMGVPAGYMGQMVYQSATRLTYGELATLSLAGIASRLRADLSESNTEWAVRSYATFLAGVRDKSTLVYGGGLDPALDVGSSSMSQTTSATLSFGILGVPAFARRPNLTPVPGLMYFYPPEGEGGDFPVLVCLSEKDLEGLREDAEWSACTEFIG